MRAHITGLLIRQALSNPNGFIRRSKRLLAMATLFWSVTALATAPPSSPSIAVHTGGLVISGLTPNASAIVFGISRETRGYITGHVRHDYISEVCRRARKRSRESRDRIANLRLVRGRPSDGCLCNDSTFGLRNSPCSFSGERT